MNHPIQSIRTFIGAKEYEVSRKFYRALGFEEIVTSPKMSYFKTGNFGFYLQDYYAKDWIENSMIFAEIENLEIHRKQLLALKLDVSFEGVRVTKIHHNNWGSEYFLYDPSGILWHFGNFK